MTGGKALLFVEHGRYVYHETHTLEPTPAWLRRWRVLY